MKEISEERYAHLSQTAQGFIFKAYKEVEGRMGELPPSNSLRRHYNQEKVAYIVEKKNAIKSIHFHCLLMPKTFPCVSGCLWNSSLSL